MRAIVFAPMSNSPGKRDATGAFQPEARRFLELHQISPTALHTFDNTLPFSKRAMQVLGVLSGARDLDCVAFFCHGWYQARPGGKRPSSGIQAGFDLTNVHLLARAIAAAAPSGAPVMALYTGPTVPLYACQAADGTEFEAEGTHEAVGGDGGFADALRDQLCIAGAKRCDVLAHDTIGHTTQNPYAVRFLGEGSPTGGHGGSWVVSPSSPLWPRWRKAMQSDMRLRFPFMTTAQIHAELASK